MEKTKYFLKLVVKKFFEDVFYTTKTRCQWSALQDTFNILIPLEIDLFYENIVECLLNYRRLIFDS